MQNIIIDNIYIFASIAFINLKIFKNISIIYFLFKFNSFVIIFSSILRCYLNNIFYSKLDIKNIIKFTINFFFIAIIDIFNFFNIRIFLDLIYIFDIYIFITFSFVLYLTIK